MFENIEYFFLWGNRNEDFPALYFFCDEYINSVPPLWLAWGDKQEVWELLTGFGAKDFSFTSQENDSEKVKMTKIFQGELWVMRCLWKADVPEKILSAVCYEDLNFAALDSLWGKKKKPTKQQQKPSPNQSPNQIKTLHRKIIISFQKKMRSKLVILFHDKLCFVRILISNII